MNDDVAQKWAWMMQFCKALGVSPADAYWWRRAEEAYNTRGKRNE